ncbi:MAG: 4,5-DOPA dioxygenase extradiol [Elusimicrobia bacterium]|nr:4,5-DOPA dioxygenase extradiol [Elusimicrobiota bacterium]
MNVLADNAYTRDLAAFSKTLAKPECVLVVSAHWLTNGTFVTSGKNLEQIYDFYGFPDSLYNFKYAAPGSPVHAALVAESTHKVKITPDGKRGIDHAAWAVLKHLLPKADVPVLELSLDITKSPRAHYDLGRALAPLRERGALIIGSGNIVHNLRIMDFEEKAEPYPWAVEFDAKAKECLENNDHEALINYSKWGELSQYAVPTNEHYLPMLYALALKDTDEQISFLHESMQNASISMRSFIIQ